MATTNEQELTDSALVLRIRDRDPQAESIFAERFRAGVLRLLNRLTRDPQHAEDLAQETLLLTLQKLRNGDVTQPERLLSYIYSTARYVYLGWRRKKDSQIELRNWMDDVISCRSRYRIAARGSGGPSRHTASHRQSQCRS
ncbi:MAG: sigma factor [Gammaproteobacteria bacterium]|nr:sigma factor [Gammaproteobacteria bacterium]